GPSPPAPGRLTIDFNATFTSSKWIWVVAQTKGASIQQVASNGVGGLMTGYSVTFSSPTAAGSETLAGFGMGTNGTVRPGGGLTTLAQPTDGNFASVFTEWTDQSVSSLDCSWDEAAHAEAIAVEVRP